MKILRITMENFGPYVDETIDFDELNEQRLFLLKGKTGSGKSTIIDGVVFALYGQDSKGRDEDVRRNSAPADCNAKVTLEFEVNGIRYRLVRSPRWQKEGRKTKVEMKANLVEIDDDGNPIAGRSWDAKKEVAPKIDSILKLTREQFTRIVVLPQGKFSEFLKSKTDDRQKLLEAIFPIDNWKEIQKRIAKQAFDAKVEEDLLLDDAKQEAHTTRKFVNNGWGPSAEEDAEGLRTIDEVRVVHSEAGAKISELNTAIESKEEEHCKRQKDVDNQKKSLDEQDKLNKAIKERENLLEEKQELDALEKSVKTMEESVDKHHDAERLKGILDRLLKAKAAVQENLEEIDEHVKNSGMDASLKEKSSTDIKQLSDAISIKVNKIQEVGSEQKRKKEISDSLDGFIEAEENALTHYGKMQYEQHKVWAAQIAKDSLNKGDPCLVCGSTEHPTPAGEEGGEDTELWVAQNAVKVAENNLQKARNEISILDASIKNKRDKLKLGEGDGLPDVSNLESEQDAHQELYDLKLAGTTLAVTEKSAQEAWDTTENLHNLDTIDKIDVLILESDKKKKFTDTIKQFNGRRSINTDGLQKQEIIDAEGKKVIDISKDLVALEETTSALKVDKDAHVIVKAGLKGLKYSNSTLSALIKEYTQFTTDTADLRWVNKHIRGMQGGKMQMDIIAWILRRWFEAVLANANTRLAEIGSGRYSLEMTQAGKEDNRSRSGLEIGVIDALSDSLKPRPTTSLSGGESFYISLALALGMSDVVCEEGGGIRLGTLFIDEGFGTLDQETLDDVMGVIDDVGGNDRVIGIISHIESLKQRIASHISVEEGGDGTSTTKVEA